VTFPDPFYMPILEEVVQDVGRSKVISRLDLTKGYYQIKLKSVTKKKTAFVCPYSKFEFNRMPFGLRNSPGVFQRIKERVLLSCRGFCRASLDDVIVYSSS